MCNEIVGVNGDEGTPVPIPNTVVKLISVEDTWRVTARENRAVPTLFKATCFKSLFCYIKILYQKRSPLNFWGPLSYFIK